MDFSYLEVTGLTSFEVVDTRKPLDPYSPSFPKRVLGVITYSNHLEE
jgi:hypothetical protein